MPKVFEGWLNTALDRTLALIGLFFGLSVTIWLALTVNNPVYTAGGVLFMLGCMSYLGLRRRLSSSTIAPLASTEMTPQLYKVLNILFLVLFCYSIVSIYSSSGFYGRPLGYFVSLALMVVIVAIEIIFLPRSNFHSYFALFKIIIIALSLAWSQLLVFPNVVGIDPWYHQWFTLEILNVGHIPEGYGYSNVPLMHLMVGETSLVTGLNYKMATMFSVGLVQVICDVLFIYLLGRFLLSSKAGLLAALLLGVANYHVMFSYWTIPNTAAAILILPVLYLLFKVRSEAPIISISLTMLFMLALILAHPLAAVWLAILLFALWAGFEVWRRLFREKLVITPMLTIATLFSVAMFSWWVFISGHLQTLADLISWRFAWEYWFTGALLEETVQYASGVPVLERIFNSLGMLLFFALSMIGCLYMISKRFGNSYSFATALGSLVILAIGFFPMLSGISLIQERWIYFAQIMLAIPLGVALLLLCEVFRKSILAKVSAITISTFLLCFLMIMSPTANQDNQIFSPNTGVRYGFTESELQAMYVMSDVWDGKIGTDWRSNSVFRRELEFDRSLVIDDYFYAADFSELQGMLIMVRDEVRQHPHFNGSGIIKLDYDPHITLSEQGFALIYSCGNVTAFVK